MRCVFGEPPLLSRSKWTISLIWGRVFLQIPWICKIKSTRLFLARLSPLKGRLKTSFRAGSPLFEFWQNFTGSVRDNHEELEQSEHGVRKEIFWTFSRKKNFRKNGTFWWFLAMLRDSQNTAKIGIFVPDVFIFCAFCVYVWCAPTCGSYSSEVGDDPRYPNLEKISRITRCSLLWSRAIFLFEEKKSWTFQV